MDKSRFFEAQSKILQIVASNPEVAGTVSERLSRLVSNLTHPSANPFYHEMIPGQVSDVIRSHSELERRKVDERLRGFSLKTSRAWQEICSRFGSNLNQTELLSIAEVLGAQIGVKVDREAKRRKEVLIKWFDENLAVILPYFSKMVLEDRDGNRTYGNITNV